MAASPLRLAPDNAARVLIIDDSAVVRSIVARAVGEIDGFTVAGAVGRAGAAFDFLRRERVDILILDLDLPGIDGLTALPELIALSGGARVLVVSSSAAEGAVATLRALSLGAADTLEKPATGALAGRFGAVLADRLRRLVQPAPVLPPVVPAAHLFDVIAIGASTGGIHALGHLLRGLPPGLAASILITQHLPASFSPYFAAQVGQLAGRPCSVAEDRQRILPGDILVAPGDAHLRCVALPGGAAVRLDRDPVANGCMPSVDPMFESVARVFGARALGVVLSGMGRDGVVGAGALVAAGGQVVAQDQASSVVWGMPGAVSRAGIATAVLPPDRIAAMIAKASACR